MRKWMRERLTRRKKTPAEPSDRPAPPPLQPAYFDAEQQPNPAPDAATSESEASAPHPPAEQSRPVRRARSNAAEQPAEKQPSEEPSTAQESASVRTSNTGRARRRRRGRGRAGRRRGQAVA